MLRFLISTLLTFLMFPSIVSAQVQQTRTIFYGGETREYIIYVPSIYSSSIPTPLMFNFHGGSGDGQGMIGLSDMRPIADTANFIAVYPSGSGGAWMHKAGTNYNDIYLLYDRVVVNKSPGTAIIVGQPVALAKTVADCYHITRTTSW